MAEPQDEDQWLYGDDKEEANKDNVVEEDKQDENAEEPEVNGKITEDEISDKEKEAEENGDVEKEDTTEPGETDQTVGSPGAEETNQDKDKNDDDSTDDELTITIGKIVTQPDIIKPPPPTHRAAATTGLKEEDFEAVGKVNGVAVTDFNVNDLEEKPWKKPGADLTDYFNYGFSEETWIKYCERQRTMRVQESGIGLGGLGGIPKSTISSNIPVSIANDNSKYGRIKSFKIAEKIDSSGNSTQEAVNTIQVMTAEKRSYSSKVLPGAFDNPDFGGPPPFSSGDYYRPPPFYSGPPPTYETQSWVSVPTVPPPGWNTDLTPAGPPPTVGTFYEESSSSARGYRTRSREREVTRERSRERSRDREDRHRSRERESRHQKRRSRSRSRSRTRTRKRSRTRSRSKSPSHRHKRKKSKRDKEEKE